MTATSLGYATRPDASQALSEGDFPMTNMDQPGGGIGADVVTPPSMPPQGTDSGGVKDQAKQAASTAGQEGKHLTAVAGDEAQNVAAEAKQQAQTLLEDAKGQLEEQSRTQRDRLVQTLGTLGDDLERMSGQADSGLAADLAKQVSRRARDLSTRLDGREPTELLDEVRDFARRRPGTFLLGALAAGVVAGRLARGAQKAQQDSPSSGPAMPSQRSSLTGMETASLPATPQAPAMADFPPGQPGEIR
jgi:hypothetical protein